MPENRLNLEIESIGIHPWLKILVVSDSPELGLLLCEELCEKEAEIYYLHNNKRIKADKKKFIHLPNFHLVAKKLPQAVDYVFQINDYEVKDQLIKPEKLLNLTRDYNAKYLLATSRKDDYPRSLFSGSTIENKVNWRLVHFYFSYGYSQDQHSLLSHLFSQISKNKLLVAGQAETKIYPLHAVDLTKALVRAMFSQDSFERLYTLSGTIPISLIDLAWLSKKILAKEMEVNFVTKGDYQIPVIDSLTLEKIKKCWWRLVTKPEVTLDQGLHDYLGRMIKQRRSGFNLFSFLRLGKLFSSRSLLPALLILLFILIIISPALIFSVLMWHGVSRINGARSGLSQGNYSQAANLLEASNKDFAFNRKLLSQFADIPKFLGLGNQVETMDNILGMAGDLTSGGREVALASQNVEKIESIIFSNETGDIAAELSAVRLRLDTGIDRLGFAQIQAVKAGESGVFNKNWFGQNLTGLDKKLTDGRESLIFADKLIALAPDFLALDSRKTYLVLLQNNMELRPTGGYIGSYAVITVERGRMLDIRVADVWEADGQLKGHVEPPAPLKKYLGQGSWYLRDANFSPDFFVSAGQAEWFLQKETGQSVDGTIGINLNVVKSLLKALGPVELPDYNEKITADNVFERAEYHAEINFFPGSIQKKSFLSALTQVLFEKIKDISSAQMLTLLSQTRENVLAHDLQFSFHDKNAQAKVSENGWSGEVRNIEYSNNSQFTGKGIADFVMLVDANLGVNKANYFITRNVAFEASILKEGELVNQITVKYHNASVSASWPGGIYKNYFRVLLPKDVEKINAKYSVIGSGDLKLVPADQIDREQDFNKNIFGFLVEVQPGETMSVIITYQRSLKLPIPGKGESVSYVMYFQKQSGTGEDPLEVKVNYPAFLKTKKVMPAAQLNSQNTSFKTDFTRDRLFAIEFSQ